MTVYVITGASGRTGRAAALRLLEQGQTVRVVGRTAQRLTELAELGAHIHEADPSDPDALAVAFEGAEAVYAVIQPNYLPDHPDFGAFQDQIAASLTEAVASSGVPRVVALSSWGAQHATGTGPVKGLHRFEHRLSAVSGTKMMWLRAGYFMENLLSHVASVRTSRQIIAPFRPDVPLPLVTTGDVGAIAADLLRQPWTGTQVRELPGERDVTMQEVTRVIGAATGLPELAYEQCSIASFREALCRAGTSANVAEMMVEVTEAVNSGHLHMAQPRSLSPAGATSLETFVRAQFLPRYHAQP
ncbi:NmrA family NAD(P)-binding protein [Streptomyces zagrosensis]|uniref:Uncharacterized protein YbjT (DUF2867 family) n=1 Tax=Streptomyces zagrosensis TaxID=1042984 RepID=A0A7W9V052_9ACTN|nr:NAD(P)H-binding protein [Streptomyces zagrosensis]MBB5937758.1 uncharacterized protein YbjT (DUF2867 family) [Streptomyces zagrosensis]